MECVAENAHGDPVSAKASLTIYDGRSYQSVMASDFYNLSSLESSKDGVNLSLISL